MKKEARIACRSSSENKLGKPTLSDGSVPGERGPSTSPAPTSAASPMLSKVKQAIARLPDGAASMVISDSAAVGMGDPLVQFAAGRPWTHAATRRGAAHRDTPAAGPYRQPIVS